MSRIIGIKLYGHFVKVNFEDVFVSVRSQRPDSPITLHSHSLLKQWPFRPLFVNWQAHPQNLRAGS